MNPDLTILYWVHSSLSNGLFDFIMPLLSYLGNKIAGFVFVILIFFFTKNRFYSLFCLTTYGVNFIVFKGLKHIIARPRPPTALYYHPEILEHIAPLGSFPSGHAVIIFMIAALCSFRYARYKYLFYGIASLVAFSRVYLGVHYPSDVIVGAILGYCITKLMLITTWTRMESMEKVK
ncbi:MAG: phosphatase PAP2 family protein [Candidatus Syntrophoarchaeum sp.]|nr:phosphatase PAP2 family protein [Candidatus Syntrophoarchaeum sp.]